MHNEIYLAGGCFWGVEHYFSQLYGIESTTVGYANGKVQNPTYKQVYTDTTGFAETVRITYTDEKISLATILRHFYNIIDPTSLNQQGEDSGTRYRTGIYFTNSNDISIINAVTKNIATNYSKPLCVEILPLENFYEAESEHQEYLVKNNNGYCHIQIEKFQELKNYLPINFRILQAIRNQQDIAYREFHSKLMPNIAKEKIIGVRTPQLRQLANDFAKDEEINDFLLSLPHNYYDENNIHGFIISKIKDFERCLAEINRFLPYIDNWATCDMLRPKAFDKNRCKLLPSIEKWLQSQHTYTLRFGIEMLMTYNLDELFDEKYLFMVARIRNDEYYVKMMIAWFFATALAKQYTATLPIIEQKMLDTWVHNKTIQKAIESLRLSKEQKDFLRQQKIK